MYDSRLKGQILCLALLTAIAVWLVMRFLLRRPIDSDNEDADNENGHPGARVRGQAGG